MYKGETVSLIFPVYNEEENLGSAIDDFKSLKFIDEIIVVDNNSTDDSSEIAQRKKVKLVSEKRQGYGFALRKGMATAKGEYIVLCEPEGSFWASDCIKLLKNLKGYDLCVGTRTNKKYIRKGANMEGLHRLATLYLGKLIQILYKTNTLTDCACTFRVFRKEVVDEILPELSVGGAHFLPETIILASRHGFKVNEVPVNYFKRVGKSKLTWSFSQTVKVGFDMLMLVLRYKLAS